MKALISIFVLVALSMCQGSAEDSTMIPTARSFPTNWISQHESNLVVAKKGGVQILFLGDSITAGWNWGNGGDQIWKQFYRPRHAVNFGVGWDRIQNLLWRIENGELDGLDPKVVVLLIGTNNTGSNTTTEIVAGISNLVSRIQFHLPQSKVILFGIFPRGEKNDPARRQIKEVNEGLAQLANAKVKFVDIGQSFLATDGTLPREMFPDLLHPNEKGYKIWANALNPALDECLK